MGVYDHMMRPSMGHKLQVDLRDSMERYHHHKDFLQSHLAQLRMDSKDLHTTPLPQSPDPPVKRWGEPNSTFSKAPEVAAQRARLAQLEQENARLTLQQAEQELKVNNSILPPIQESSTHDVSAAQTATTAGKHAHSKPNPQAPHKETANKPTEAKAAPQTVQPKKVNALKGRKFQKQQQAVKKPVPKKYKPLPQLKLPTIPSASLRRSVWDSGHHHLHVQGPSTHLEKNQVDEECRNFNQRTKPIPLTTDGKRTEIQRPVGAQWTAITTKVQFRRHPPPPPDNQMMHSTPTDHPITRQPTIDHFPQNASRLSELEDGSTDGEESDDGTPEPQDREPVQRTILPAIPMSQLAKSSSHHQPSTQLVPPLRLQRGLTPSAISTATARSGATYMSLMSQETQEWKGAYMSTDDPHHKGRMLMEILHAARQRMQDNEEDLRLSGDLLQAKDKWSLEGRSDVMLMHKDSFTDSGATTARSSVHQQKLIKLPHHKKRATGGRQNPNAKLHRYLNRLSQHRKAGEQRHHHHQPAPFQLATMTIREITQSSLEHQSAVHTAS